MNVATSRRPNRSATHRIVVLLAALLLIVLVAMAASRGDVCYILTARFEFEQAVEVSRLARAAAIVDDVVLAEGAARKIVGVNSSGVIVPGSESQVSVGAPHVCLNQFPGGLAA
jgi:ABC-type hemin transport system substrate-binding protein